MSCNFVSLNLQHQISARIISYVINGMFNDGGKERLFGWARLDTAMGSVSTSSLKIADIPSGGVLRSANRISTLLYYDRPLMVTEAVGNHRARSRGLTDYECVFSNYAMMLQ